MLKKHNLQPLVLGPKEGLALINGTQFILAFAIKAVERLNNALNRADLIGAMSLEGLWVRQGHLMQGCMPSAHLKAQSW
jgi:histidine ammonia-lyase